MSAAYNIAPQLRHYPYIGKGYAPAEVAERVPRLEAFVALTGAWPCKYTAKHRNIGDATRAHTDHATSWERFCLPFVMSEEYPVPELHKLGLLGTVHIVVPQRHSIYRPDTYMILHTLPKYRDALIEICGKVGAP
jgi:hypothetical protein